MFIVYAWLPWTILWDAQMNYNNYIENTTSKTLLFRTAATISIFSIRLHGLSFPRHGKKENSNGRKKRLKEQMICLWGTCYSFVPVDFLCTCCSSGREVLGIINDPDGKAVEFANIAVKGTNTGTSTAKDGFFELKILANKEVVVYVSCMGFATDSIRLTFEKRRKSSPEPYP